jgi:hypothetical protein
LSHRPFAVAPGTRKAKPFLMVRRTVGTGEVRSAWIAAEARGGASAAPSKPHMSSDRFKFKTKGFQQKS